MTDFERGQETCNCAGSNLFLCDMPTVMQERLAFRGLVGGQPTEIFPVGEVLRHPNTVEGTRGRLEIVAAGMRRSTLMEDLSVGTPLVPEDLRTYVGVREVVEPPADPRREMLEAMIAHPDTVETMRQAYIMSLRQMDLDDQARMRSEFERAGGNGEGLFVIGLQFSTMPDGEFYVDNLAPDQTIALFEELGRAFGVDISDVHSVYTSLGGAIGQEIVKQAATFEVSFRNLAELQNMSLNAADQLRLRRIFLKELLSSGIGKIFRHRGQTLLSFKGPAGRRIFMQRTAFPANSIAVLDANVIAGNRAAALRTAAGSPFRGSGGVFLVLGGVLELMVWLDKPDGERFIGDLFVAWGIMVATAVVSAIVATAAITFAIAAGIVAIPAALVGVVIGAVAVGIGFALTLGINAVSERLAMRREAQRFLRQASLFYEPEWHPIQSMGPLEGINYLNQAHPEEFSEIMERGFGG
ncbi:hypothetical protein [Tritonibacter mobilis]|uniref:hypothetical protein n=1 Tax=Tritonibacter mobilis TaxID=379347 RepID=UPI001403C70D|nr:hypothetical protein [Tritonibacter mobilis]NHM20957.1 hypothetical protein [Tritonibacter mobilis]NHM25107.1 hypothetical protein [Tritonibacter mobilis]